MIKSPSLILLTWSLLLSHSAEGQNDCQNISDDFFAAQIILSFASWKNNEAKQHIAIYYYNPGFKYGDKIGLHGIHLPATMFRPGKHNDEYWIHHGDFLMTPLQQTIDNVKQFMDNTQEIVLLHFKEFPYGFETEKDHLKFMRYLTREFGTHLRSRVYSSWQSSFKRLWERNKRLIILYDNFNYIKIVKMWRPIPQMWGNVQSLENLRNYLAHVETKLARPRASMAELTMDANGVISHAVAEAFGMEHMSLRQMAASTGPHVTQWYNEFFYQNASIIAVDYLNSTGIVEVALEWNDRKFSSCYYTYVKLMRRYNKRNNFNIIGV
ncbi:hypothetical protein PV327_011186 [Microctonus hyperodae]|uniref:Uncharacterized protein n=1 Tax=Microctonus hyperodae TaxID=165561 RepID=A0AA39C5X4_MICHY|nr:hypothetical protein PV327_011186 [Microctonus hyperodae]